MWLVIEAMCSHNLLKPPQKGGLAEKENHSNALKSGIVNENHSAKTTFAIIGELYIHWLRPMYEHDVPLAVGFDSKPESVSRLVKACVGPYP
jgi:hypothetical protein